MRLAMRNCHAQSSHTGSNPIRACDCGTFGASMTTTLWDAIVLQPVFRYVVDHMVGHIAGHMVDRLVEHTESHMAGHIVGHLI